MKVSTSKHNHRSTRNGVLSGTHMLRVVGSQTTGFRHGGEKNNVIQAFGQIHKRQIDAIAYGVTKFDKKAVKLVQSKKKR